MRQIFLDTETTGLYPDQGDRVIEIGCVELFNRKLTGKTLHLYLNPDRDSHEEALRVHGNDWNQALELYQRSRVARTARIVLSSREMGRLYHAKGVERLVRNDLWRGRTPERFYDAMEWLYGWTAANCLAA